MDQGKRPAAAETAEPGAESALPGGQQPQHTSSRDADPFLDAALAEAGRGFRVAPVTPGKKKTPIAEWKAVATRRETTIRCWWARAPGSNLALPTGLDVLGFNFVVIDIDKKNGVDGFETLKGLGLSSETMRAFGNTRRVITPNSGEHFYFSVPESAEFSGSASKIAPGIDVRARGNYVLAPGSVLLNDDGAEIGRYRYRLPRGATEPPPMLALPDDLRALLTTPRAHAEPAANSSVAFVDLDSPDALDRARAWLRYGAPLAVEGHGGDAKTFRVAARLKDFGVSERETLGLMLDLWNDRCSPPWNDDELKQKIANAYAYGRNAPGSAHPASYLSDIQITPPEVPRSRARIHRRGDAPVAVDWLVKDLLSRGAVSLLGGQSRTGKSFVSLAMAKALGTGERFFGKAIPRRAGTAFILGEGLGTMGPRVEALHRYREAEASIGNLPLNWAMAEDERDLAGLVEDLRDDLRTGWDIGLGLVVLDTLAAIFGADDEDKAGRATSTMQILARIADQFDCAILGVAHHGKNAALGLRGSSGWTGSADSLLSVTAPVDEATGFVGSRSIALTKTRHGEAGPLSGFRLEPVIVGVGEDGEPIVSAVVVPCAFAAESRRLSANAQLLAACFTEVRKSDGKDIDGQGFAPREMVRSAFFARYQGGPDRGNRARVFKNAAAALGLTLVDQGAVAFLVSPKIPCSLGLSDPAVPAVPPKGEEQR